MPPTPELDSSSRAYARASSPNGPERVIVPPPVLVEEDATAVETLVEPAPALLDEKTPVELWAIVLAGGIGSRFWPLSTADRPKQLLALVTERPLICETVMRLGPLIPPERVLVVTSRDIAAKIHGAIREVPTENLLVEPQPLGTAAALAWGASEVVRRAGDTAVCCTIHADLAIAFPDALRAVLQSAARLARDHDALVAIGARPTRPETAFGYIRPGSALVPDTEAEDDRATACWASRFVEKPDSSEAERLIAKGALWHTGILLARGGAVLDALATHTPEVALGLDDLAAGDVERFAWSIRSTSIERGLLERSDRLMVVPADVGWDDVGTWESLRRARDLDDNGNGARGPVHFADATGNVVHTEGGTVVMYGVSQLLVVVLPGLTFVTTLERAKDLRPLLDALPGSMRMRPVRRGK